MEYLIDNFNKKNFFSFLQKLRHGLGKWFPVTCDSSTPRDECGQTMSNCDGLQMLEGALCDLAENRQKDEGEIKCVCLAKQIHRLVDAAPVKSDG